jgi:hypothetical protein
MLDVAELALDPGLLDTGTALPVEVRRR